MKNLKNDIHKHTSINKWYFKYENLDQLASFIGIYPVLINSNPITLYPLHNYH